MVTNRLSTFPKNETVRKSLIPILFLIEPGRSKDLSGFLLFSKRYANGMRKVAIMEKLSGKTAIVTGGSRGIGSGIARVYAEYGARVLVVGKSHCCIETAEQITADLGLDCGCVIGMQADVASADDMVRVAQAAMTKFGSIDILCANAGICDFVPFSADNALDEMEHHLNVNTMGVVNAAHAVLPMMTKQHSGAIVITGSVTGDVVSDPGEVAYATSKAALIGFTKSLAREVAGLGITVNIICPGVIHTDIIDAMARDANPSNPEQALDAIANAIPLKRMGTPRDVGELAAFLGCPKESGYLTAARFVIDGGSTLPETAAFPV